MIHLDFRDSRPIYEQVKSGLRRLIVQGVFEQDEKLPSVRELASSLAINPNTIQRAYRELEQEGVVYTVAGKGSFSAGIAGAAPIRSAELLAQLDQIVAELCEWKVPQENVERHVKAAYARSQEVERRRNDDASGREDL